MRPKSYRHNLACGNCKHAVAIYDYDTEESYFCGFTGPERPISGSLAMSEGFDIDLGKALAIPEDSMTEEEFRLEVNPNLVAWMDWKENREVSTWAICDEHEAADES